MIFKAVLAIFQFMHFHINNNKSLGFCMQSDAGVFPGVSLNLQSTLRQTGYQVSVNRNIKCENTRHFPFTYFYFFLSVMCSFLYLISLVQSYLIGFNISYLRISCSVFCSYSPPPSISSSLPSLPTQFCVFLFFLIKN